MSLGSFAAIPKERDISLTMTVATFPASISAIMRLKFGLSKVTPETPSSIKNTGFVKPLSEAYFVKTAF